MTAEDTKHITSKNAQLFGFNNIVAKNIMQCDSSLELTDALINYG